MTTPSVDARALYLPGSGIISADDPRVTHSSYTLLGLRCTVCGEPVLYKNGHIKVAHFAHFPTLDPQKREACNRRRSSFGAYSLAWNKMSRGQKLRLFQKRFFNIVKNALPGLAPYNQIQKLENTEQFDPICIQVLAFLRSRKGYFIKSIRMCDSYKVRLFAVDVACEAFDYLMVRSSEQMALLILRHLISQKSNLSSDNKMLLEEIGTDLSSLLLTLRWPQLVDRKEYQKIRGTNVQPPKSKNKLEKRKEPGKKKKIESQKPYRSIKLFQKVESGYNLFVYLRKNKVCLSSAENDDWTNESFLGTLNAKGIAKQESTDNRFNNQLLSGKLDVLIIQKSQLFPDYEELIERIFFPS